MADKHRSCWSWSPLAHCRLTNEGNSRAVCFAYNMASEKESDVRHESLSTKRDLELISAKIKKMTHFYERIKYVSK